VVGLPEGVRLAFQDRPPGRLMNRGHPAGDLLEAYAWQLLEEGAEGLRLRCHVPDALRNPQGHLFGGFTPIYVDLVAICTVRAAQRPDAAAPLGWLATLNMRVDYFDPVVRDFGLESRVIRQRGANYWVETRFVDDDGTLLAQGLTTLRATPPSATGRGGRDRKPVGLSAGAERLPPETAVRDRSDDDPGLDPRAGTPGSNAGGRPDAHPFRTRCGASRPPTESDRPYVSSRSAAMCAGAPQRSLEARRLSCQLKMRARSSQGCRGRWASSAMSSRAEAFAAFFSTGSG